MTHDSDQIRCCFIVHNLRCEDEGETIGACGPSTIGTAKLR